MLTVVYFIYRLHQFQSISEKDKPHRVLKTYVVNELRFQGNRTKTLRHDMQALRLHGLSLPV